jgi:16S rRNA (guanine1207-N2)-methyltransferase
MPDDRFETPTGALALRRPGQGERSPLQAWDAADSYLLDHLAAGSDVGVADGAGVDEAASSRVGAWSRCLVVNDAFGALALALAGETAGLGETDDRRIWSWSDSAVAHDALAANAAANGIDAAAVVPVTELAGTEAGLGVDLVVVKIPKSLALLEHQLCELSAVVDARTTVIGAGMTRHIHNSTIELFERILGPSRTTLARRKARLILTDVAADLQPTASMRWPTAPARASRCGTTPGSSRSAASTSAPASSSSRSHRSRVRCRWSIWGAATAWSAPSSPAATLGPASPSSTNRRPRSPRRS